MKTITLECSRCNNSFERKESEHLNNLKRGRKSIYCSLACFNNTPKERTCQHCGNIFIYKAKTQKFCSRSCSAKHINRKRKVFKYCGCGALLSNRSRSKYCANCRPKHRNRNTSVTLQELKDNYTKSQYHAKIREHSRWTYKLSGLPMACKKCGYDLHVDVCHKMDLKDFELTATLYQVNAIDNLVALCKNHHWEFDNGYCWL